MSAGEYDWASTYVLGMSDVSKKFTAESVTYSQCAYCGRFQKFPDDGQCVGCGAGMQPSQRVTHRGKVGKVYR